MRGIALSANIIMLVSFKPSQIQDGPVR